MVLRLHPSPVYQVCTKHASLLRCLLRKARDRRALRDDHSHNDSVLWKDNLLAILYAGQASKLKPAILQPALVPTLGSGTPTLDSTFRDSCVWLLLSWAFPGTILSQCLGFSVPWRRPLKKFNNIDPRAKTNGQRSNLIKISCGSVEISTHMDGVWLRPFPLFAPRLLFSLDWWRADHDHFSEAIILSLSSIRHY